MTPFQEYCEQKSSKSGSSFYYSFLFLPEAQRQAIMVIYAFCREVDDIVDNFSDPAIAKTKILWWQEEIERTFSGTPRHPISQAIAELLPNYDLKKHLFIEILQGMNMDLEYQGYEKFSDMKLYCHCVASTVGLLVAEIFGYSNLKTLEYAKNLGIAFQLINIIRDVGEDARRHRIYLPEEYLQKFNISSKEILDLSPKNPSQFKALLKFHADLAKEYYQTALNFLPPEDRYHQRCGLIMAKIYFRLLKAIEETDFDVLNQKISITPIQKLWHAWRAARYEQKLHKVYLRQALAT